ncbi:MAG: hypothetical protein NC489_46765 [Ruminococcus flavefaciens]|nr:hypothetical protein [Ruminococcus flavefaciens]
MYPEKILSSANACQFVHGAYVTERADGTHPMVNIRTGSGASFGKVKFVGERYRFRVDYNAFSEAKITLYFGDKVLLETAITPTKNSVLAEFNSPNGDDYLGMEISGAEGGKLCEIINIKFERI